MHVCMYVCNVCMYVCKRDNSLGAFPALFSNNTVHDHFVSVISKFFYFRFDNFRYSLGPSQRFFRIISAIKDIQANAYVSIRDMAS